MINVGWLIEPDWVPSELVTAPDLESALRWSAALGRHPMREAYGVDHDAIFADFLRALGLAP